MPCVLSIGTDRGSAVSPSHERTLERQLPGSSLKEQPMKPSCIRGIAAALSILPCLAVPAVAQASDASLLEALSLLSGGLLVPRDHPPEVTHDGGLYHVRVPLPALTAPRNASIDVDARPRDAGVWDITALTLPPAGSLTMVARGAAGPGMLSFSVGRQAFHARIDLALATPSPFTAEF